MLVGFHSKVYVFYKVCIAVQVLYIIYCNLHHVLNRVYFECFVLYFFVFRVLYLKSIGGDLLYILYFKCFELCDLNVCVRIGVCIGVCVCVPECSVTLQEGFQ